MTIQETYFIFEPLFINDLTMRIKEGNKETDILKAAIEVFAKDGFYKAKISKIAEKAGVAAGSVYVYYKNKDDLLFRIFEELWEKLYVNMQNLGKESTLSPSDKIDKMIDLVFDLFIENPSLAIVFVNEQQNHSISGNENFLFSYERFLDEGEKVIKEGINKGVFSNTYDLKIFRNYIFGAIRNLLFNWANDQKSFRLEKIRRDVKYLTKHGIIKTK